MGEISDAPIVDTVPRQTTVATTKHAMVAASNLANQRDDAAVSVAIEEGR